MAISEPLAAAAWYTLASLPVDTQPLISLNTPRFSILNSTCRGATEGRWGNQMHHCAEHELRERPIFRLPRSQGGKAMEGLLLHPRDY